MRTGVEIIRTQKGAVRRVEETAIARSELHIDKLRREDIDSYKCVAQDPNSNWTLDLPFSIDVPDYTCERGG